MTGFHLKRCNTCHGNTNYTKWRKLTKSSNYTAYPVKFKLFYEPYIITHRKYLHRYDARYRGYGINKMIQLVYLSYVQRYTFYVLPRLFIMHGYHAKSTDRLEFRKVKF